MDQIIVLNGGEIDRMKSFMDPLDGLERLGYECFYMDPLAEVLAFWAADSTYGGVVVTSQY